MNVNIGGTIIHDVSVSVFDDDTKLSITYNPNEDNLSLEGVQSIFEEPQPYISMTKGKEDDTEIRYFGYIDSEISVDGDNIVIVLSKPDVEKRLDYLFGLVLSLKDACACSVVAANSMMNEHSELMSSMIYDMLRR